MYKLCASVQTFKMRFCTVYGEERCKLLRLWNNIFVELVSPDWTSRIRISTSYVKFDKANLPQTSTLKVNQSASFLWFSRKKQRSNQFGHLQLYCPDELFSRYEIEDLCICDTKWVPSREQVGEFIERSIIDRCSEQASRSLRGCLAIHKWSGLPHWTYLIVVSKAAIVSFIIRLHEILRAGISQIYCFADNCVEFWLNRQIFRIQFHFHFVALDNFTYESIYSNHLTPVGPILDTRVFLFHFTVLDYPTCWSLFRRLFTACSLVIHAFVFLTTHTPNWLAL